MLKIPLPDAQVSSAAVLFRVSVIVPTIERPAPLRRALRSLVAQRSPPGTHIEIIVVDNSRDGSATAGVAAQFPRVRIAAEPHPGLARARNAGLRSAAGTFVAFLDDDQEAHPDWVAQLIAAAHSTGAAAVFGPVTAKLEDERSHGALGPFFERKINARDGEDITAQSARLGTNGALFLRRALLEVGGFDVSVDRFGGEDSLAIARLRQSGGRFVWASDARAVEWVAPERATRDYVLRRKFLSGRIRTLVQNRLGGPAAPFRVLRWMGVGAVQCGVGVLMSLLWAPFSRDRAFAALASVSGGLGKIFWGPTLGGALYDESVYAKAGVLTSPETRSAS